MLIVVDCLQTNISFNARDGASEKKIDIIHSSIFIEGIRSIFSFH